MNQLVNDEWMSWSLDLTRAFDWVYSFDNYEMYQREILSLLRWIGNSHRYTTFLINWLSMLNDDGFVIAPRNSRMNNSKKNHLDMR